MVLGCGHPDLEQVESEEPEVTEFTALWTPNVGERPPRALRIERVRELIQLAARRPTQAPYRVATLDGSAVQEAAASALLKLFEEPSPRTVLLLRAAAVEALPPPITSRCQVVRLGPVPAATIAPWLERDLGTAPEAARAFAALGNGRPGLARRLAESAGALEALDKQAALWLDLQHADTVTRLDQAATWGKGYATARAALSFAGVLWHELLQAAAGQSAPAGASDTLRDGAGGAFSPRDASQRTDALLRVAEGAPHDVPTAPAPGRFARGDAGVALVAGAPAENLAPQPVAEHLARPESPLRALQSDAAARARAAGTVTLGRQLGAIARASRALDANAQPRLVMEWLLLELPHLAQRAA